MLALVVCEAMDEFEVVNVEAEVAPGRRCVRSVSPVTLGDGSLLGEVE